MKPPRVLVVSAHPGFIEAARRALGNEFAVAAVETAKNCLRVLDARKDVQVVISDLALPDADGVKLLARLHRDYPKVMRILMVKDDDCETLARAIRCAHVYSTLSMRSSAEDLRTTVTEAVKTLQMLRSDAECMRDSMLGTVRMLVDILELTHPRAVRRSKRIRRRAQEVCTELNVMAPQSMDMVALLSNIGCVGLPSSLMRKLEQGVEMTPEERKRYRSHPSIAAHLLSNVPRMGQIAEIIRHQNTPASKKPPLASCILKACIDLDQMQVGGVEPDKALEFMRNKPEVYSVEVLDVLDRLLGKRKAAECNRLKVSELEPGMIMQVDMTTEKGAILLHRGEVLSEASHLRIQAFADLLNIVEPVCACVPSQ